MAGIAKLCSLPTPTFLLQLAYCIVALYQHSTHLNNNVAFHSTCESMVLLRAQPPRPLSAIRGSEEILIILQDVSSPKTAYSPFHVSLYRGAAIGCHGWYLFLVLQNQSDECKFQVRKSEQTYVLNVLKALLEAVITGTCFSGSQARIERCKSLSSAGDLSIIYDIQACLLQSAATPGCRNA